MKPGWAEVALGDVCRIVSGATPKTSVPDYWGGDVPWATPKDLSDLDGAKYLGVTPRTLTEAGLKSCAATVLPAGSVLLSSRAPIGLVAINQMPVATNQGFKSLVPTDAVDSSYLYWWIRTHRRQLDSLGRGATFKEVSTAVVAAVHFPLPPLDEQKRIAAILDEADELQAKRRAAQSHLVALGNSVFSEAVGDDSKLRPLDDFLSFITSGARGWAKYYAHTGSRFVRSLDVQMNSIGSEAAVWVQAPHSAEAKRISVREHDVLLTITGSRIGRVAAAPQELEGAYVSQHVAILRIDSTRLCPAFVARYLSLDGQRQIRAAYYGQTKPGLNFKQIRSFSVPVPSMASQESLMARIGQVDAVKARFSSSANELDSLIASLQARAFRGEL